MQDLATDRIARRNKKHYANAVELLNRAWFRRARFFSCFHMIRLGWSGCDGKHFRYFSSFPIKLFTWRDWQTHPSAREKEDVELARIEESPTACKSLSSHQTDGRSTRNKYWCTVKSQNASRPQALTNGKSRSVASPHLGCCFYIAAVSSCHVRLITMGLMMYRGFIGTSTKRMKWDDWKRSSLSTARGR